MKINRSNKRESFRIKKKTRSKQYPTGTLIEAAYADELFANRPA